MIRRSSGRFGLRFLARASALTGTVLVVSVCGEKKFGTPTGPNVDTTPPVVQVILPGGASDTLIEIADSLKFNANATDNVKLDTVHVTVTGLGSFVLTFDTTVTFKTTTTTFTQGFIVPLPQNAAGQRIQITVAAVDGSTNRNTVSDTVHVNDTQAPLTTMLTPAAAVLIGSGDTIRVLAKATDPSGIRYLGARLFSRDTVLRRVISLAADSLVYGTRLTARVDSFRVIVPATLKPGSYLLQVFSADSSPNYNKGASADLAVAVRDVRPPTGTFLNPPADSQVVAGTAVTLLLHASDNTGVVSVTLRGYSQRGSPLLGTDTTVLRFQAKTVNLPLQPADTTPIVRQLLPVLTDSTAEPVYLEARLTDVGGNVAVVTRRIQVVAGPSVRTTAPANGLLPPVGVPLSVSVNGYSPDSLTWLGYQATGVVAFTDSLAVAPVATVATRVLSLLTTQFTPLGADTIVPFGRDKVGRRILGSPVFIVFGDTIKPTVAIDTPAVAALPVAVGDSVYVRVHVTDNRGVTRLVLTGTSHRGSASLGTDTTVTRYVAKTVTLPPSRDTVITRYLRAVPTDSLSEIVTITATASDSSGNASSATATVRIVGGPKMTLVRPTTGALTSPGRKMVVEVLAVAQRGVRLLGWRAAGVVNRQDSLFQAPVNGALKDTVDFIDTLSIPIATSLGTFTITAFGVDSLGDVSAGSASVTVVVQSGASDTVPPQVSFTVGRRVEVSDSLTILARDPGGIRRVGWTAKLLSTGVQQATDTTPDICCSLSEASIGDVLNLPTTLKFPAQVVVQAFAWDSSNNRGQSVAETLTVVNGRTFRLPGGSQIGDAIYNKNRRELYLSNTALDRLEVFSLASNSFVASIPVGSRPVGLAMWPKDTLGNYADTVIVANSGGVNFSLVDVTANRREYKRYRLPNYLVESVRSQKDASTGAIRIIFTHYEFSDRPMYVASVCRPAGAPSGCGEVVAVYSTTPTGAQSLPGRGYVAWENLTRTTLDSVKSNILWEAGTNSSTISTDTLQITAIRDSVPGQPAWKITLGAGVGVLFLPDSLPFQDSTFVRSSGDFRLALVGEGGTSGGFARALTYDPAALVHDTVGSSLATCAALSVSCHGTVDYGVSPALYVSDFFANRASRVSSIAANFNGRTLLVRADSIYAFDRTLKLTGIMSAPNGAVGMDFHPNNTFDANTRGTGGFGGTLNPNNRLVFAARPDSSLDVFDTFFYGRVTDTTSLGATIPIPIRNALIGPVRVATDAGNTVLFGLTSFGLVSVRLPTVSNSLFPVAPLTTPPVRTAPTVRALGVRSASPPRE